MTNPKVSELDLYINDIVDKLRAKYGYADKNRLKSSVRFYYHAGFITYLGIHRHETEVIELTYTELTESMNKKELPNQIKELL